jgi:uncharacterized protein DUF3574
METKSLFTIYVGGQFDQRGNPIPSEVSYRTLTDAMHTLSLLTGGVTMLMGWGAYIDPDGTLVTEKSARIEILANKDSREDIEQVAQVIRNKLNSESVLLIESPVSHVTWIREPKEVTVN